MSLFEWLTRLCCPHDFWLKMLEFPCDISSNLVVYDTIFYKYMYMYWKIPAIHSRPDNLSSSSPCILHPTDAVDIRQTPERFSFFGPPHQLVVRSGRTHSKTSPPTCSSSSAGSRPCKARQPALSHNLVSDRGDEVPWRWPLPTSSGIISNWTELVRAMQQQASSCWSLQAAQGAR